MPMKIAIHLTRAQLRVVSAISSNFAAFWLAATITVNTMPVLILNVAFAIVSWYMAVKAEEYLEEYD